MFDTLKSKLKQKMDDSFQSFLKDIKGLRTGRASTHLLEPVVVNAYGSKMPLNQVATVSVQDPRVLQVQVWDQGLVSSVEKAIQESNLGLNPQTAGATLRIQLPDLSEERRKELIKTLLSYAEKGRVAMRDIRRIGMDDLKKAKDKKEISEDEFHTYSKGVDDLTKSHITQIDKTCDVKKTELLQI
jgi:ribosome recycling factor